MLKLDLAFSRDDIDLRLNPEADEADEQSALVEVPGRRRRVPADVRG